MKTTPWMRSSPILPLHLVSLSDQCWKLRNYRDPVIAELLRSCGEAVKVKEEVSASPKQPDEDVDICGMPVTAQSQKLLTEAILFARLQEDPVECNARIAAAILLPLPHVQSHSGKGCGKAAVPTAEKPQLYNA